MNEFLNSMGHIPEWAWAFLVLVIVFGFRLIRTLLTHQQKMAQIIQQNNRPALDSPDLEAMRHEIELLRATVNQQTIMLDDLHRKQLQSTDVSLQEKIG